MVINVQSTELFVYMYIPHQYNICVMHLFVTMLVANGSVEWNVGVLVGLQQLLNDLLTIAPQWG